MTSQGGTVFVRWLVDIILLCNKFVDGNPWPKYIQSCFLMIFFEYPLIIKVALVPLTGIQMTTVQDRVPPNQVYSSS